MEMEIAILPLNTRWLAAYGLGVGNGTEDMKKAARIIAPSNGKKDWLALWTDMFDNPGLDSNTSHPPLLCCSSRLNLPRLCRGPCG